MEEEADYYFNEEDLLVFTASYHLKRGNCCKNECKHCPWNYGRPKNTDSETKNNKTS
ncbi:DUF5522 domain-containing protein [Pedobacter sp. L105]|uniref:DUF5522 domain-containing protein n=1 Tax=Pedobacter sp. L105 TaxID=1641871 RepID=UPI00131B2AB4|nr:DUF5522 domain-containing protein [Pedobacter sp. L105]